MTAQSYKKSQPFTHTYSIVARDTVTGDIGVAVQSHWFSVGSVVTYGKAGVGVVATQSLVNPSYGPKGLELMAQDMSPKMALDKLICQPLRIAQPKFGLLPLVRGVLRIDARCSQGRENQRR